MFLVDDDDAGMRQRCEHRRARAQDYPGRAGARVAPAVQPRFVGQRRVQHGDRHGEPLLKTFEQLRSQRDLRNQHQCL